MTWGISEDLAWCILNKLKWEEIIAAELELDHEVRSFIPWRDVLSSDVLTGLGTMAGSKHCWGDDPVVGRRLSGWGRDCGYKTGMIQTWNSSSKNSVGANCFHSTT